jgi:hypothetical protein
MIKLSSLHNYFANAFTLYGGGGNSGGGNSTTNSQPDPALQAYRNYGLDQATALYQKGAPAFYPGQNYISADDSTTAGLDQAKSIADQGVSPLVKSAQQQQQDMIDGKYLQNNPYFLDAARGAAQGATTDFNHATNAVNSNASAAGRYGSNAAQQQQDIANTTLANSLSNTYGTMAYNNYTNERNNQNTAATNAPTMAQASYAPANELVKIGQAKEGYANNELQGNLARYNYNANAPQAALQTYMNQVNGSPWGSSSTTNSTSSGGGKIVCTMMNESYGIGSFRNRVWLAHSAKMPNAKVYETGYHTLFLPLVAYAKKDGITHRIVKSVLEHIAKHRTADIYKQMRGHKRDDLGRLYRAILEPICYVVGKVKGA